MDVFADFISCSMILYLYFPHDIELSSASFSPAILIYCMHVVSGLSLGSLLLFPYITVSAELTICCCCRTKFIQNNHYCAQQNVTLRGVPWSTKMFDNPQT